MFGLVYCSSPPFWLCQDGARCQWWDPVGSLITSHDRKYFRTGARIGAILGFMLKWGNATMQLWCLLFVLWFLEPFEPGHVYSPAVNFADWYLSRNVIDCLICIIFFVDPRILYRFPLKTGVILHNLWYVYQLHASESEVTPVRPARISFSHLGVPGSLVYPL